MKPMPLLLSLAFLSWSGAVVGAGEIPEPITSEWQHKLSLKGGYAPLDGVLGADNESFYSLHYEPSFRWYSPEKQWHKWQVFARGWLAYDKNASLLQEQDDTRVEGWNAELRELYVRRALLGDDPRFSLTFGRQRYADRIGLWWDDALESVRFDYTDSFAEGFVALGQKLRSYNTDIDALPEADQDVLYAFGEYKISWLPDHWLGGRSMLEHDYSGQDLNDSEDYQGVRFGLFAEGETWLDELMLDYQGDLALVYGEREQWRERQWQSIDVQGWAMLADAGITLADVKLKPRFSMQLGITDKPGLDNDGFFQNQIQSDRMRPSDYYSTRLVSSFFRLELQNLKYVGLGVKLEPWARSELNIRLTDLYRRTPGASGGLRFATDTAGGKHLGQMLDVQWYCASFPRAINGRLLQLDLVASAGAFFQASGAGEMDTQYQMMLGLAARF